jgi:thiol-disulfide isomerase/thioredoxin
MSKSVKDLSDAEIKEYVEKVGAVLTKHGSPSWVSVQVYTECVNILNAGQQQCQKVFQIEGSAPLEEAEKAKLLKKEIEEVLADVREKEINVGASYGVGTKMGVIENANHVFKNEEKKEGITDIKHEAGQVLLLDFWATWCPPCQAPMKHNQEMLEKNANDWGDRVRLIGLSIDQDYSKLVNHIEDKNWKKVEHYHVRNGTCTADKDYGVQGVPHVLLVDTEGQIVFMGHPASRKIEDDINNLLKGVKLEGEGTKPKGAPESSDDASVKVCSDEDAQRFAEGTKEWVGGMAEKAAGVQRAFLVMTVDQKWNMADLSSKNHATVHTVLVGPKDKIDVLKEECQKFNEGSWNSREQIMPM